MKDVHQAAPRARDPASDPARLLEEFYRRFRRELTAYVTRLVLRPEVAQEIVQQSMVRWIEAGHHPADMDGARAWFFRVSTNLAIDYRRRHSTVSDRLLPEAKQRAAVDESFLDASRRLVGSPELKAIAREHLAVCFACTMRNLPDAQSAALLLVEVNDFSLERAAEVLDVNTVQVKNALQSARRTLREKYGATCRLVSKQGVCHQCVELGAFFNGVEEDPLVGSDRDLEARLRVLRDFKEAELGPWHQLMMRLVDEMLSD